MMEFIRKETTDCNALGLDYDDFNTPRINRLLKTALMERAFSDVD